MMVLGFSGRSFAQQRLVPDEWWFNVPGAPVNMELSPKKDFLLLTNYSQKQVSEYQLGCILIKDGQFSKIYKSWQFEEALRLLPSTPENLFVESVDDKFNNGKICEKGKLAVIAVSFKDGSEYSIKGESSKRAEKP